MILSQIISAKRISGQQRFSHEVTRGGTKIKNLVLKRLKVKKRTIFSIKAHKLQNSLLLAEGGNSAKSTANSLCKNFSFRLLKSSYEAPIHIYKLVLIHINLLRFHYENKKMDCTYQ